jgi:hypothetical protein
MNRFEKIFFGILIGGVFPLFLSLLLFIIWFYFDMLEKHAPFYLLAGLLLGLITDIKYLKCLVNKRYDLPVWFLIGVYLFYNVLTYGFFMGFPVFNIVWGLVAGYYFGFRIIYKNIPPGERSKLIKQVSIFTGIVMTLICISSGFLALVGSGAGADLQGMLRLDFAVTKPMIWGIILIGGFLLIAAQIVLTRFTIIKTIKRYETIDS